MCIRAGYTKGVKTDELSFRDVDWLASLRGIRSLRDFARIKKVQVAQVSKVFRKIEDCVDGRLFVRSTSGITLTPFGDTYTNWAEEFLVQFHQFQRGQKTSAEDRVYTIGSYAFIQNSLVINALSNHDYFAHERFRIVELNPLHLSQIQQIDFIPIVLHLGPIPWPSTMDSTEIGTLKFNFYIGSKFYQPDFRASDLEKIPFITPAYYSDGRITNGSDRCPIPLHKRKLGDETSTASQAIRLMSKRKQITFLPDCSVQEALKKGEIKRISIKGYPGTEEKLYLTVKSDLIPSSIQKCLKKALVQELKNQE